MKKTKDKKQHSNTKTPILSKSQPKNIRRKRTQFKLFKTEGSKISVPCYVKQNHLQKKLKKLKLKRQKLLV